MRGAPRFFCSVPLVSGAVAALAADCMPTGLVVVVVVALSASGRVGEALVSHVVCWVVMFDVGGGFDFFVRPPLPLSCYS
jgi:hypothetical protein